MFDSILGFWCFLGFGIFLFVCCDVFLLIIRLFLSLGGGDDAK